MQRFRTTILLLASAMLATPIATHAATGPAGLLAGYTAAARSAAPTFSASAERGQTFFTQRHGAEWSCSTCHTATPSAEGRHASTNRAIAPLAPAANPKRFADEARVEKWFGRNCRDVVGRACTPAEKADVLAWLVTVR